MNVIIVGCGAMGGAVLSGCLEKGIWKRREVKILSKNEKSSKEKAEKYGVFYIKDEKEIEEADVVLIAVKPHIVPSVLDKISKYGPKHVISLAAAVTLSDLSKKLPKETEVVRVMPNTPASVGAGLTAITCKDNVSEKFLKETEKIFNALGETVVVTEKELDALGALSGSGPGYAFVIMDALSDAGVEIGLSRKLATKAAAFTLYGAGKMALETKKHPGELRDEVTSPGGTTITGIHAMEKAGIRTALKDGVLAAFQKTKEMSKK